MPLFNEIYPEAKAGDIINELVEKTDRLYPCDICRKVTGWRDIGMDCEVPVCSTECGEELYRREAESTP